jgi:hypothetical protein
VSSSHAVESLKDGVKMELRTNDQVRVWCSARDLEINDSRFLRYRSGDLYCFSISLEEKPSRVIALADYLVPTWPDVTFAGALLWIRERGVWGDFSENAGAMMLQQMRMANGATEPLEEFPGQLFAADELVEFHSYFLLPLLFGWDAFVVPEGKDYFLFVSHDGIVEVVSRRAEILEELRERVSDWNPKPDASWYPKLAGL